MATTRRPPSPRRGRRAATVTAVALTLVLSACSGKSPKLTGVTPSTTATTLPAATTTTINPEAQVQVSLYFVRGSTLAVAHREEAARTARFTTLKDLFDGPSATETGAGLTSDIPTGTVAEGLQLRNGVAYLDLNANFFLASSSPAAGALRVAQVVYTLTSSSGVTSVVFLQHGLRLATFDGVDLSRAVTRSELPAATGSLLMESPAVGDTLSSPLDFAALSAFSGALEVQVVGSTGQVLNSQEQTVSAGETIALTLPFPAQSSGTGQVKVYTVPAASGPTQLLYSLTLPFRS